MRLGIGIDLNSQGAWRTPKSLSGLALWLRADLGIHTATGVSQWDDQSGIGDPNRNFVQATASAQPTKTASDAAYNGKPTLHFSRPSAQFLRSGIWSVSITQPCTIIIIGHDDNSNANDELFFDGIDSTNRLTAGWFGNTEQIFAGTLIGSGVTGTSPAMRTSIFAGAQSKHYINSKSVAAISGNPGSNSAAGLTLGSAYTSESTFALNGTIAEVIVLYNAISATDFSAVSKYVSVRYGLTIT